MRSRQIIKWSFVSVMIIGVVSLVSFSAISETAAPESMSLTLAEAIDLGVKNNDNISLSELNVETSKINWDQAVFQANKLEKKIDDSEYHIPINQDVYMVLNVNPALNENAYDLSVSTRDYTVSSIKYGIETAYYSLQVARKAMEVAELTMERNETQLNNVQAKLDQGMASKIDLCSVESNYLSSQAAYAESKDTAAYAEMVLNQMLGLDIETPLILEDRLTLSESDEINVDEAFISALKTDYDYILAENNNNSACIMSDYTQKYTSENTFDYKNAESDRQKAQVAFDAAKTDLEIRVRYAYKTMNTAFLNYKSFVKSRDLAEEAYRLAELRYQAGLCTVYDVQDANTTLQTAEMGLLNAMKDYNLLKASFDYGIFIGNSN